MKALRLEITQQEHEMFRKRVEALPQQLTERQAIKQLLSTQPEHTTPLRDVLFDRIMMRSIHGKPFGKNEFHVFFTLSDELLADVEATAERWKVSIWTVLRSRLTGADVRAGSTKSTVKFLAARAAALLNDEEGS